MWETPFDLSMLSAERGVVIHCPDKDLADELFEIFQANGVGSNWPNMQRTQWEVNEEETAYFYKGGRLLYGPKIHAEDDEFGYSDRIKCTFYGIDTPDFDTANDNELCAFLGIGGG